MRSEAPSSASAPSRAPARPGGSLSSAAGAATAGRRSCRRASTSSGSAPSTCRLVACPPRPPQGPAASD
eukprot:6046179-Alexandrium_andersonii.AAC.1